MKTGMDYILQERKEQIEKHGYSVQHAIENPQWYDHQQLLQAGTFCLIPMVPEQWPDGWDIPARDKIEGKDRIGQLACAGAFFRAHEEIFGATPYTEASIVACADEIDKLLKAAQ